MESFVVRTSVRSMKRTEVRTTNLTYWSQSIGHDIKDYAQGKKRRGSFGFAQGEKRKTEQN